jgi:hypothetical protein
MHVWRILFAMLMGIAVAFALKGCKKEPEGVRRFELNKWKAAVEEDQVSVRRKMLVDLMNRYRLEGMTREDVVQLLGPPERSGDGPEGHLSYVIGLEEGSVALDHEWLYLKMHNSKVNRISVVPD